jgi:hypothetical protein
MSLVLIPMHLLRYVCILTLSRSKANLYVTVKVKGETKETSNKFIKFLKILQHPLINLGILVVYILIFLVLEVIIYLVFGAIGIGGFCFESVVYLGIFNSVAVFIWIFLWSLGSLLDFILHITNSFSRVNGKIKFDFKCLNPWLFFVKQDPFFYRFELYIIAPLLIVFFFIYILFALLQFDQLYKLVFIIIYTIFTHCLYFYLVIYVLLVTIIQLLRQCICRSNHPTEEIDKILFDTENGGFQMFESFSRDEYSIENVSCWSDIQSFKKLNPEKDQEQMKKLANDLFQKYLNGNDSPLEVNVNSKSRKNVEILLKNEKLNGNLFDEILSGIKLNLSDTYGRLHITAEFALYSQKTKFKEEMGLDNGNTITRCLRDKKKKKPKKSVTPTKKEDPKTVVEVQSIEK